jgi:hypothetical protein
MEMVQAQRENKVAMLGLQLSLTKALMPAIHAGDDQLQEFIATLNSPHLTAEQKISRISHQFLLLEDDLVHIIEQALPHIAEQGGHLGVALAGAVWHGFENSNAMGKVVIAAWIFNAFGGRELMKAGAMRVGGMIGTDMGIGLASGVVGGFIAYEIFNHLSRRTQGEVVAWANNAAHNFVNYFIKEINEGLNDANILSILGVDAPQIGEWKNGIQEAENEPPVGHGTHGHLLDGASGGRGGGLSNSQKRHNYEKLWGKPPPPGPPPWPPPRRSAGRIAKGRKQGASALQILPMGGAASPGRPIIIHLEHKTELDGKVVAENTIRHALDEAALQ